MPLTRYKIGPDGIAIRPLTDKEKRAAASYRGRPIQPTTLTPVKKKKKPRGMSEAEQLREILRGIDSQ